MKICNFCAKTYEKVHKMNEAIKSTANKTITILDGLQIFCSEINFLNNSDAVICTICLKQLKSSYEFVQQIKEAEKILRLGRDIQHEHDYSEMEKDIGKVKLLDLTVNTNIGLGLDNHSNLQIKFEDRGYKENVYNYNLKFVPILPKTSNIEKCVENKSKGSSIVTSRLYKCLKCSETFKSFKHVREHEQGFCKAVSPKGISTCLYCHLCFNSEGALNKHQTENHKDGKFVCFLCKDKMFTAKGYLMRHAGKIHQHKSLHYFCGDCQEVETVNMESLEELSQHFIDQHTLKAHKDDIPQQEDYKNDEDMDLEMHEEFLDEFLLAHTNENSFQFSECWEALDLHLPDMLQGNSTNLTNNQEFSEAFPCPKCFEQFKNPQPLLRHLAENHNLPVLICRNCRKSFASLRDFKAHKEVKCSKTFASDTLNLKCPYCSKIFKNSLNLKQHLRIVHTQLKRHICQLCDKQFSTLDHLKKHVLSQHQNERKHLCNICEKTFTQLVHLKQHLAIHTTGKTLQCSECPKKFWRKIDLERHRQKKHGDVRE